jgi:hypothetical protein
MEYLKNNANVLEVYFAPEDFSKNNDEVLEIGWKDLPHFPEKVFKNRMDFECYDYVYRDITYSYDTSNDFQKVISKTPINEYISKKTYTIASFEETLPTHRFPCTTDLNNKEKLIKIHFKYNNRIFFIIEKNENNLYVMYLRYNHDYNVDIDKMKEDWDKIYSIIERSLYKK